MIFQRPPVAGAKGEEIASVHRLVNKDNSTRIQWSVCFGLQLTMLFSIILPLECNPIIKAQEVMDVDFIVFGTLRLIKVVLPSMPCGHIIQCSSEGGVIGIPFFDIYAATKFAIEGFT